MKVEDKYFDEIFDFKGQWDMPSKCGLKIIKDKLKTIILVTELYQDNPGTSITYNSGRLLKQICETKNIDKTNIIYLECNPSTNSKLSFYDEEIFELSFDDNYENPKYRKLNENEIKLLNL